MASRRKSVSARSSQGETGGDAFFLGSRGDPRELIAGAKGRGFREQIAERWKVINGAANGVTVRHGFSQRFP